MPKPAITKENPTRSTLGTVAEVNKRVHDRHHRDITTAGKKGPTTRIAHLRLPRNQPLPRHPLPKRRRNSPCSLKASPWRGPPFRCSAPVRCWLSTRG